MVAVTGSGDATSFGKRGGGCNGDVVAGCTGDAGCSGGGHHFLGGRDRGGCSGGGRERGGLFGKHHRGGCDGGCTGAPAGCTGVIAAPAGCTGGVVAPVVVPAPVVVAAPCAPACEPAPVCCEKEKRKGLFSRLCGKKKDKGCDTCAVAVPACEAPCATGTVVVPPAATPPATMPPVAGKKDAVKE
ncbi:hypothetical protein [Gemmata sp.]|uniref:hypothetical protein n=1 Tax=Gemmata sp. TaxID=1914242 RepID=UPI003F6ED070